MTADAFCQEINDRNGERRADCRKQIYAPRGISKRKKRYNFCEENVKGIARRMGNAENVRHVLPFAAVTVEYARRQRSHIHGERGERERTANIQIKTRLDSLPEPRKQSNHACHYIQDKRLDKRSDRILLIQFSSCYKTCLL